MPPSGSTVLHKKKILALQPSKINPNLLLSHWNLQSLEKKKRIRRTEGLTLKYHVHTAFDATNTMQGLACTIISTKQKGSRKEGKVGAADCRNTTLSNVSLYRSLYGRDIHKILQKILYYKKYNGRFL